MRPPIATSRHVPSPPSTTTARRPSPRVCAAPRRVSSAEPVPGPSSSSPPARPASARSAIRPASAQHRDPLAPASSAADGDPPHDADLRRVGRVADRRVQPADILARPRVDDDADGRHARSRRRAAGGRAPHGRRRRFGRGRARTCVSSAGLNGTGENGRADAADRRVEVVERVLLDLGRDLGAEAAEAHRLVGDDDAVGLARPTRRPCRCRAAAACAGRSPRRRCRRRPASRRRRARRRPSCPTTTTVTSVPGADDVGDAERDLVALLGHVARMPEQPLVQTRTASGCPRGCTTTSGPSRRRRSTGRRP